MKGHPKWLLFIFDSVSFLLVITLIDILTRFVWQDSKRRTALGNSRLLIWHMTFSGIIELNMPLWGDTCLPSHPQPN